MKRNLTIDGIKHALTSKRLSARELTTDFFIKINARNPQINAYLELSPERAYAQADKIDSLVVAGKPLPPLGGVPVAIKDVLSTRGITTTCGSKILRNYVRPTMRRQSLALKRLARSSSAKPIATSLPWAAPTKTPPMAR